MEKIAPVKVAALKSMDKRFGGCNVGGNGYVVHVAKAQKGGIVRVGVLVYGVAEEKKKVNFVAGDSGSNLLTAAVASAEEAGN